MSDEQEKEKQDVDVTITIKISDIVNIHEILYDTYKVVPTERKEKALYLINDLLVQIGKADGKLKGIINDFSTKTDEILN